MVAYRCYIQEGKAIFPNVYRMHGSASLMILFGLLCVVGYHESALFIIEEGIMTGSLNSFDEGGTEHRRGLLVPALRLQKIIPQTCTQITDCIRVATGSSTGISQIDSVLQQERIGSFIVYSTGGILPAKERA